MKYVLSILVLSVISLTDFASAQVSSFQQVYNQAEQLLITKNYGDFGELAPSLLKLREDDGYANLVPLSERLLEAGREPCSVGDSNCSFFVKSAVILSPTDPWTLFIAATNVPSFKEKSSLFFSALSYSTNSPTFFFKAVVTFGTFLLVLLSFIF